LHLLNKIKSKEAKILVVGLGYVGLPLAIEIAKRGFQVVGIDRERDRVDKINHGVSYVPDILEKDLSKVVKEGKFKATQNFSVLSEMDIIIICVPTPLDKNKVPVIKYIENVVDNSLQYIQKGQLFLLESTTYPGTTEEVIKPRIETKGYKIGKDVFLAFSPERIDPGNESYNVSNIPKVVGGVTPACTEVAKALYEEITLGGVYTVSSPRVAEMEKLLENIFRIVNISLVNEMALLCDKIGIDIWEVIEAAKSKPYGFMPFYPGPGTGGHCIPLDPFYLSWKAKEYDITARFIELAGEINDAMPEYVVSKVSDALNENKKCIRGSNILIIGVAYKKDIDDARESPAVKIARLFLQKGARLYYHDPYIPNISIDGTKYFSTDLTAESIKKSDLVLIATDHTGINYDLIVKNARCIYDARNALLNYNSDKIYRLGAWQI
jgi:UDP-N-acetyl-D-glucosamine dehydrogenase